ncbi:MAG: alpha-E domain-containing protein [Phaeodactylibacter sp.]|nr:alpha-E domain-containing protein [Phaeodactylibacter sp.]MCB9048043.1 alpha-E domain-containing protein [Lewinellaceae bacterium]
MLSRVANSIYWMNRYIERAENYARFMSVNFNLILDMPPSEREQWEPLLVANADNHLFYQYFDNPARDAVLQFMSFDQRNPNSILSCLRAARENARSVRESITKEMWEHLNQVFLDVQQVSSKQGWKMDEWQDFFNDIKMASQLFYGIVDSTLSRNESWHFSRLGRFLERADKTSRFLDIKYFILLPSIEAIGTNMDLLQWSAVLKSASAYNMYRQAFRVLRPEDIIYFLVLDRRFPRSIYYCLSQAEQSLLAISDGDTKGNKAIKVMGRLRSELEFTDASEIVTSGLHEYLDDFQKRNNLVGEAIFETYFALKPVAPFNGGTQEQG